MSFFSASPLGPSHALCPSSVSTTVGEIVLTRTPRPPHSAARTLDTPTTPNFDAQYATCCSSATVAACEAMLIMAPPPDANIRVPTDWHIRKVPLRFSLIVESH